MKTPPEMLSPKDCSYLADLLETTLTLAKKAQDFSENIEDKPLKKAVSKDAATLSKQYSTLLNLLK